VTEIAPEIFSDLHLLPDLGMQFNQFLVRDQEPLLYHTGMKAMFPAVARRDCEGDRSGAP